MMTYTPSYKLCKALHGLHPNIINPECNTNPVQSAIFRHSQVLRPNLTIKGLALFLCPSTGVIIHKAYFCRTAHVIKNHNVSLLCKVSQCVSSYTQSLSLLCLWHYYRWNLFFPILSIENIHHCIRVCCDLYPPILQSQSFTASLNVV